MRGQVSKNGVSGVGLSDVAALVASSGIIFNVRSGADGLKMVDVCISHCEDWDQTEDTAHVRLRRTMPSSLTERTLVKVLKRSIGGDWEKESVTPSARLGQLYTHRLADFVPLRKGEAYLLSLDNELKSLATNRDRAFTEHAGDGVSVCRRYPLRSLLNRDGLLASFWQYLYPDVKTRSLKWIKQLRNASLNEYQIASYGPELTYQTSLFYKSAEGVPLQQAIRMASDKLYTTAAKAAVKESFESEPWDLVAGDGLDEPIEISEEEYEATLRPMSDFFRSMEIRLVREQLSGSLHEAVSVDGDSHDWLTV